METYCLSEYCPCLYYSSQDNFKRFCITVACSVNIWRWRYFQFILWHRLVIHRYFVCILSALGCNLFPKVPELQFEYGRDRPTRALYSLVWIHFRQLSIFNLSTHTLNIQSIRLFTFKSNMSTATRLMSMPRNVCKAYSEPLQVQVYDTEAFSSASIDLMLVKNLATLQ